jgi:CheY-like chemotaxis protein
VSGSSHDKVPDKDAFLDIGPPVMDGYELARRLRELPRWRDVKLFALGGYGRDLDRARLRDAGFDQQLVKPIDLSMLERHLNGA